MKFLAVCFFFILKSVAAYSTSHGHLSRRAPAQGITITNAQVEKFRDLVKTDLAQKVDDLIELIVADVERAIVENGEAHAAFIQTGINENVKKMVKQAALTMVKHLIPVFEGWIADAVRPPVTTPTVFNMLIKPVCQSIFDNIYLKLKLPASDKWEDAADEGDFDAGELGDAESDDFQF
ncbi:uncharacterized protein BXIN_0099 [Babesia sp. Xinjiang]|uniref:uncharacterized protein n=1 Tax=Babesia sp. Xinjiang TaxID=462227 RepID=UPI000A261180|nr:uncharacterized protein BXIN_0099 [Babesia sp. Xinjiang]ORM39643.1 hypothetical protein BXIN_0099 [Babesia sp. Xinjiang]